MEKYIVVDFMSEADPKIENRVGFCDPIKYPYVNMHPTRYGVYRTGEDSALVAYIPDWHENPELLAKRIAFALEELSLV
jgi:hypothetical protein